MRKRQKYFLLNEDNSQPKSEAPKSPSATNEEKPDRDSKLESLLSLMQTTYQKVKSKEARNKFANYAKEISKKYENNQDAKELDNIIDRISYFNNHTQAIDDFFNPKKKKEEEIYFKYTEEERLARENRIGGRLVKLKDDEKLKKQLTPQFNLSDFLFCNLPPMNIIQNFEELAKNLQILYDKTNCKIEIISGYRSRARSKVTSPSTKISQHEFGNAADIKVVGLSPLAAYTIILKLIKKGEMKNGGLGVYDTFVHYDTRNEGIWRGDERTINKGNFTLSAKDKKDIQKIIDSMA
jgi:hypothetical protein